MLLFIELPFFPRAISSEVQPFTPITLQRSCRLWLPSIDIHSVGVMELLRRRCLVFRVVQVPAVFRSVSAFEYAFGSFGGVNSSRSLDPILDRVGGYPEGKDSVR